MLKKYLLLAALAFTLPVIGLFADECYIGNGGCGYYHECHRCHPRIRCNHCGACSSCHYHYWRPHCYDHFCHRRACCPPPYYPWEIQYDEY